MTGLKDHRFGHPRQRRYLQAVGAAGRPLLYSVHEGDGVAVFHRIQMDVGEPAHQLRQAGQLEVVGGKQGVGANLACQLLGAGPCQREAVVGAGAAANLVHQHQTAGGGVVEDIGGFGHLHHKGGAAGGEIVRRPDAGKDTVDGADAGAVGRHEGADMGQQHDERSLAHVGGFTAHVGAGDDQHPPLPLQPDGVGDEGVGHHLLHHRMAARLDQDLILVDEGGAAVVEGLGPLGQVGQHVQLRQGGGGLLQIAEVRQQGIEQLLVEAFLQRQRLGLGGEYLVLVLLQLIDDVALVVFQRLATDVVGRHQMAVGTAHLDIEAVHLVVTHLEGIDAGQQPLALLDAGQAGGGAVGQIPQLVQLGVEPFADDTAIANEHRRHLHHGALQQVEQLGEGAGPLAQLLHRLVLAARKQALQFRQLGKGLAQPGEVTRTGRAQGQARQHPLHVADLTQQSTQLVVKVLLDELFDGALAPFEDHPVADRLMDPAFEQPAPHGGSCAVQYGGEGVVMAAGQILGQLQVAAGGGIHDDRMIGLLEAHAANVGQGGALGVFHVLHQTAGGAQGGLALLDPEAHQILGTELLAQQLAGGAELEFPLRAAAQTAATLDVVQEGERFWVEQLGRVGALQLRQQGLFFLELVDEEAAGAYVHGAIAEAAAIVVDGGDQVILPLAEQRLVGDGARGDDANDLALHRPLAGGGIPYLFTDGGRFAQLHQLGQIPFDGVIGYTRHGDGAAGRLATLGQGDVEQLGGLASIVVEQFVEVAHPVEQQDLRVLGLEGQILLHHGRVGAEVGAWRGAGGLVLCGHVLFQKGPLRACVCGDEP